MSQVPFPQQPPNAYTTMPPVATSSTPPSAPANDPMEELWRVKDARATRFANARALVAHLSKVKLHRIVPPNSPCTLKNNASIDTNPGTDDANGSDGKTVAAARFNQRFFEHTLGWDFDNVWQWDTTHDHPVLRFPDLVKTNTLTKVNTEATTVPTEDLLTQQVRANFWL